MNKLSKFFRLASADRVMLLEALYTSVWVKFLISVLPMRWYARFLGKQYAQSAAMDDDNSKHIIYGVGKSIVRCRKIIVWKNRCMVEAITSKRMLKRRGLASTLYLGVSKGHQKMMAHAWLRCGTVIVTGKQEMEKFVVVSTFA